MTMSRLPGGGEADEPQFPSLDFLTTPEIAYNPELIAEKALWPLADLRWGGDFRNESEPNLPSLSVSRAGFYHGQWYEVTLDAEVESDEFTQGEGDAQELVKLKVATLSVFVEQLVPEQTQAMIELALEQGSEALESLLEDDDDLPEHQLRAMVGVRYLIDSEGDYSISPYRALRDSARYVLWNKGLYLMGEDEDDEANDGANDQLPADVTDVAELTEPQFGEEDVRNLLIAVHILKAPQESVDYLARIVSQPETQ